MIAHEVVYVGGPRHGEREARQGHVMDAPAVVRFPTFVNGVHGECVYRMRPMADTPGAITYTYERPVP